MRRTYDVTLSVEVTVEIDDEAESEFYEGETILTAHTNPERFVEGSTQKTVIGSLAQALGMDNRRMGSVDGWADFPEDSASAYETHVAVESVYEITDGKWGGEIR